MNPAAILNPIAWSLITWAFQGGPAFGAYAQAWSEPAASILIGGLWQGAVVASGLALCLRLAPRISAKLRYGIWAAGFAALAGLPLMAALFERLTEMTAAPSHPLGINAASGPQSWPSSHPILALDARWSLAIAALWLAASLMRAASLAIHAVRMRRLWKAANPVPATGIHALLQSAAVRSAQMSGFRGAAAAELCVTNDLDRPCVIGFFRPRILIPAWLLDRLRPEELEQVVLHELEHLRRMDNWANLLQKLCLVVFPLNPGLWWLERRLCAEREMACDDAVVGRTQAPRAYAACLAGLAERGLEHRNAQRQALHLRDALSREALSLGAWQRRPELAERVHRLLRRTPVLSPAAAATAVALVGCGLVAGTITLARSPELVAFVAPAQPASSVATASAHNLQAGLEGDKTADFTQPSIAFAGSGAGPYRAVKTLAILPSARIASVPRNGNGTSRAESQGQSRQTIDPNSSGHSLASLIPTAIAAQMKAQQVSQSAPQQPTEAGATQTSYLVLTTYEEVRTTGSDDGTLGDAVSGETAPNSTTPASRASTSVTVTRLVFRLDQATQPASNKSSTSNAKPASNAPPASNSAQPVAIPYRDGWFVIQL